MPSDLGQRAGQFDTGGAAADDGEPQPGGRFCRVRFGLGTLERQQQFAAQGDGIVQGFQAGRSIGPLVVAEVGVGGAGGQQQAVVVQHAAIGHADLPGLLVDGHHFAEADFHIALVAKDMAQRCRDIRSGQAGGGHLVQQRLEQVMVAAVDQGDAYALAGQGAGGPETGKTTADNDQWGKRLASSHGGRLSRQRPRGSAILGFRQPPVRSP
ncbi:hypothetical protein G6F66_013790 [Rhizopus arrhizus]|nr:hypothetical protein G6F66_013790 [Rhizopus arrhizus]